MFLMSGLIFPVDNIPWQIRWISNLVWGKHYISIVRDAFLAGGGWRANWLDILIVGFIGVDIHRTRLEETEKMQVNA